MIKHLIKEIKPIVYIYYTLRGIYREYFIADIKFIKIQFRKMLNRELNIEMPEMYNDKLQWLKLNWRDPIASKCADKYGVREIIKEKIGEEYLNELYAVYENINEIDLDKLPKSFVLKGTHGSGFNIICKDKDKMDWKKEFKHMKRWLHTNYYVVNREWVYRDIKPRIICEKFIETENEEELRDYRFFCFNGEPFFICVDLSITDKSRTRRNLYDLNWKLMDEEISYPKERNIKINKPEKLSEMIELSKQLAEGFPHVRIDFYNNNGKIIFGEMTFFHQNGYGIIRPKEFELKMGQKITLFKNPKKR